MLIFSPDYSGNPEFFCEDWNGKRGNLEKNRNVVLLEYLLIYFVTNLLLILLTKYE